MNHSVLLLHPAELILKGKNRSQFEEVLRRNIAYVLGCNVSCIRKMYGRMIIDEQQHSLSLSKICEMLCVVPGIASLVPSTQLSPTMDALKAFIFDLGRTIIPCTFAIRATRIDKKFPFSSAFINRTIGALMVHEFGWKVNLDHPDVTIRIYIEHDAIFVATEKYVGRGGLPTTTSGTMLALLSAGIDSPVAVYMMQSRGVQIHFIHFHSYPITSIASQENVRDCIRVLQQGQSHVTLTMVPLADMQRMIAMHAPSSYRIMLYRRAMFEIAIHIAQNIGATALCSGESLGQVASQTLSNLITSASGLSLPLMRPLIGMSKEEIIHRARTIGTYDISIRPYEDCCTLLVPAHVVTRSTAKDLKKICLSLPWKQEIEETRARAVTEKI